VDLRQLALPDAGIWEMRNRHQHFVYSKVMNWVALDRGIRLGRQTCASSDRAKWMRERDLIYEEVMTKGWNEKRRAFTQFYGSEDLDASLLIMPLVFFMAPTDPRCQHHQRILQGPRMADSSEQHLYIVIRRNPASTDFRVRKALQYVLILAVEALDPRRPGISRKLD